MGENVPYAMQLLKEGRHSELWSRYCGFLDLSMAEFMDIQRRLLMEQVKHLGASELGRKIMGRRTPKTVEEFQKKVPFTRYEDYASILLEQKEEALPERPFMWSHTSGRSGEYPFKWIPYTQKMYEIGGQAGLACFLLSACKERGHVALKPGDTSMYSLAPPPYISGLLLEGTAQEFDFDIIPSPEEARKMDFQSRIQRGFRMALSDGLDFFYGVTSILLRVSEQFSNTNRDRKVKISE